MFTIEWAENPVYVEETNQVIDITVKFFEFSEPIRFAASADDPEEHGRILYTSAIAGDYGPIAPYVPPPVPEDQPIVSGVQEV